MTPPAYSPSGASDSDDNVFASMSPLMGQGTQNMLGGTQQQQNQVAPKRARAPVDRYSPAQAEKPKTLRPVGPVGFEEYSKDELADRAGSGMPPGRYNDLIRNARKTSLIPLLKAGFEDEAASGSPVSRWFIERSTPGDFYKMWVKLCDTFLLSMPSALLYELVAGNVDSAYRESRAVDGKLARYLEKVAQRSADHPACYVRPLTDGEGKSIALDDLEIVLNIAEHYHECDPAHAQEAYKVDCLGNDGAETPDRWSFADSAAGARRHLQIDAAISPARVAVLKAFIAANRVRITHCRSTGSLLEPPIQYVGYAMNSPNRQKQHDSRSGSGWLSMLVRDICDSQWHGKYSIKFFVVCLLSEDTTAAFAEIILSRYLRAYVIDGGLSIDWAGKSTNSLNLPNMTAEERLAFWVQCQEWYNKELSLAIKERHQVETRRRRRLYAANFGSEYKGNDRVVAEKNGALEKLRNEAVGLLRFVNRSGLEKECDAVDSDSNADDNSALTEETKKHRKRLRDLKNMKAKAKHMLDTIDQEVYNEPEEDSGSE